MLHPRTFKIISLVLVCLGFLFIVVGYATPGWVVIIGTAVISYADTKVNFGLWYFRACTNIFSSEADICITVDYKDLDSYTTGDTNVKISTDLVGKSFKNNSFVGFFFSLID